MMFKKMVAVVGAALCLAVGLAATASAQDYKKFAVGLKSVYVYTDEDFDGRLQPFGLSVEDDITPGIDIEYFFHKNVSAQLFAAVTEHEIQQGGEAAGSVRLLPPTLTVKYHPMAGAMVSPYVGAGVNFTMPFSPKLNLNIAGTDTHIDDFQVDNSWGWVAQAGADFNISPSVFFNIDYKYVNIDTEIHAAGTEFDLDINPHLFAFGLGYRF